MRMDFSSRDGCGRDRPPIVIERGRTSGVVATAGSASDGGDGGEARRAGVDGADSSAIAAILPRFAGLESAT